MKLLIDTNIFLEILLEQDKVGEARELLSQIEKFEFYISDYSLHSIGLILFKRKQYEEFLRFLRDMLLEAGKRSYCSYSPGYGKYGSNYPAVWT